MFEHKEQYIVFIVFKLCFVIQGHFSKIEFFSLLKIKYVPNIRDHFLDL